MYKRIIDYSKKVPLDILNKALSGTIVVTIGSLIGSVFSYLLHVFLGRMLTVVQYGEFNSLLSLSVILAVFGMAFSTALIKLVSELKVGEKFTILTRLFWELSAYSLFLGGFVFICLHLISDSLSKFLRVQDYSLFLAFGLSMGISLLNVIPSSYLQGLLRFKAFALWTVLCNFFKFVIPAILVYMGFKVFGVFVGISVAVVLSYVVSLFLLKKNLTRFERQKLGSYYKRMLLFVGPVIFVQVGMTMLNNVDVILVKHYFEEEAAGMYSGLVTIGKVFLFGAGTVGIVMFPQISAVSAKGEDCISQFKPFLLIQLVLIFGGIFAFTLFPKLITTIMFGQKFLPSAEYLPRFAIFIGLYVLVNFIILFFLAVNRTKVYLFQIPAVLAQIFLIRGFHDNLVQVINVNVVVALLLLVSLAVYFYNFISQSCLRKLADGDVPA